MIIAVSFAGIMAIIGWDVVVTLLIIFSGLSGDYISAWGNAFGWPSLRVNWTARWHVIVFIWVISFLLYFLL